MITPKCPYCGERVNPNDKKAYWSVVGWRSFTNSTIVLQRTGLDRAHAECIDLARLQVTPGQTTLDGGPA